MAVESCLDEEAVKGKLLSLLRAEPDVQNQRDTLISQCFMRNGSGEGGGVRGFKNLNSSLDESGS